MTTCWTRPLLAVLLAALPGLAGCGGNQSTRYVGDTVTRTDFEDLPGWGSDLEALTDRHAHSGSRAIFTGPDREYSLTYHMPLWRANPHVVRGLDVSAWVYLPSDKADAVLTVQVARPGGQEGPPLYNSGLRLLDQVHTYGKWQLVRQTVELPANLPSDAELRLFLYRGASSEPVYLDDLDVKARE